MSLDIIVLIVICLLSLAAAALFVPENKYKKLYILIAFLAVLIRIAIVSYLYGNGTETFGTDGLLYHLEGIRVAQQLAEGIPFNSVNYSYTWYTVFVGMIYHLFGVDRYVVSYINIVLAFFAAILLLKMALNHGYQFINAAVISLVFLYFPNLFLWTADSRKESLLIIICFLCWYSAQRFIICVEQGKSVLSAGVLRIVFVCILMWFCTIIRIYMFAPLSLGIVISQLVLYKKTRSRWSLVFIAAVLISTFIILIATVNPLIHDYHAIDFSKEGDSMAQDVGNKVDAVTSIAFDRNIIVSIVNYLILPYPGHVDIADIQGNHKVELIVRMDMIAWYVCMLLMLTGIWSTLKRKDSCFMGLLAFLAAYIFINALVVENVADTIYRYRSIIIGTSLLFIDWNLLKNLLAHFEGTLNLKSDTAKADTVNSYSIKH